MFLVFLHLVVSEDCTNSHIDIGRYSPLITGNFDINNCFFSRNGVFNGKGGIIYLTGVSSSLNMVNVMVFNGSSNDMGGVVYFDGGNVDMNRICCSKADAVSGIFAYVKSSSVNMQYISVSQTYAPEHLHLFRICYGVQRFDYNNASMNLCASISGARFAFCSSLTSSYCTFSQNIAKNTECIELCKGSSSRTLAYANIIGNYMIGSLYGIVVVYDNGAYTMSKCIFMDNNKTLFYCESGSSLFISDSVINHVFPLSSGIITTSNIATSFKSSYKIDHFYSFYCPSPNFDFTKESKSTIKTVFLFIYLL